MWHEWAWQRPSSPVQSVNEVEENSLAGSVLNCVELDLFHPHRKLVVVGVWWNVIDCAFWCLPGTIGIVCGLPVGFQWSVKISWQMGLLEEQDGTVVGVFWLLLSGPLPVH